MRGFHMFSSALAALAAMPVLPTSTMPLNSAPMPARVSGRVNTSSIARSKRTVAQDRRQAKKRKAQKRARRLGHA